jgi:hypothetical protein
LAPVTRRFIFDLPGTYRIRVQGRLDVDGAGCIAGMTDCTSRVRGKCPITTLTGALLDQAGLISVLTQLFDMGYPLLALQRLPDRKPGERKGAWATSPQGEPGR